MLDAVKIIKDCAKREFEYTILEKKVGSELDSDDRSHLSGYLKSDKTKLSEPYALASDRLIIRNTLLNCISGGVLFVKDKERFRTRLLTNQTIDYKENSVEMNGLWVSGSVPRFVSLVFWAYVCEYLRDLGGYVYFSYDTSKSGLDNFYRWLPGETIYEGPVRAVEGMPGDSYERIVCLPTKVMAPHIDELLFKKATHFLSRAGR
jgi:hypothetical protein